MANKPPKIPKIDLSLYNDAKNIPLSIEKIIAEGLIAFNCDVDSVIEHFNANPEVVNTVYIKYYSSLSTIYQTNLSTKGLDESLNDSCAIFNKHIKEIKKSQSKSSSKTLKSTELNNLCRVVEKITSVRDQATRSYDATVNKLNNNINALKISEAKISGPIEDDSIYLQNQTTVAELLTKKYEKRVQVIVTDITDNSIKEFPSLQSAAEFFDTNPVYISKKCNDKTLYKDRYLFRRS